MLDNRTKTFMAVVDAGSFSMASKELFLSPVSVKKQMDSLEAELGMRLLDRTNRGISPTAAGEILYGNARRIQRLSDDAIAQMSALSQSDRPTIRVGTSLLRPCSRFLDAWARIGSSDDFAIEIVPFEDGQKLDEVIEGLGDGIDCFLGPCDAPRWFDLCNVLKLGFYDCAVAVPKTHPLAERTHLAWEDLEGESMMLVKPGASPVIDSIRIEIESKHPSINLVDAPYFYDIDTFNECERLGILMETLDAWRDVHPGFVTLPMEWAYRIPYGLFYSKEPSERMSRFIDFLMEG